MEFQTDFTGRTGGFCRRHRPENLPAEPGRVANGDGPATWILVSSPILDMLKSAGFGTTIASPIRLSSRDAHFVGYMFIDDLDLIHSNKGATPKELICEAQEMIRTYARGVRATGGAISPGKCFWSLLHHSWRGDKWTLSSTESMPGALTVEDIYKTNHITS